MANQNVISITKQFYSWENIDYATFLQQEISWKLYVMSDQLDTLDDQQKTIIFSVSLQRRYQVIWNASSDLISIPKVHRTTNHLQHRQRHYFKFSSWLQKGNYTNNVFDILYLYMQHVLFLPKAFSLIVIDQPYLQLTYMLAHQGHCYHCL